MQTTTLTLLFLSLLAATHAHMGLEPARAVAGSRTIVSVRIGHDCGDETVGTTNFTVVLPPMLPSVKVELQPHWRVLFHKTTHMMTSSPPMTTPSEPVEYISAVTFLGFLPDGFYQMFNLRIKMPETPGAVLWFKGYQDCHNQGTSLAWEAIPNATNPSPRYPARNITLVESEDDL